METQQRLARRRWATAIGAVAALSSLPVLIGALPVSAPTVDPAVLRAKILSAQGQYAGYAETVGALGLPDLPEIDDVGALLGGRTRVRAWSDPARGWRVDVIDSTGEVGIYSGPAGMTVWNYENNVSTDLIGDPGLRLPRAADLVPPVLAQRLLNAPGGERLEALPPRRIAGIAAVGLRLIPTEAATTVAHLDIWADPDTGLPVEVRLTGKGGGPPSLVSRFLDLEQGAGVVAPEVLRAPYPDGAQYNVLRTPRISDVVDRFAPAVLPDVLAGRARSRLVTDTGESLRTYGQGFATFAVTSLPFDIGQRAFAAARSAAGTEVDLADGAAVVLRTPLLTLLVASPDFGDGAFLLAGPVGPDLLMRAADELLTGAGRVPGAR